jgi:hypothetical protein|tara:strand:+ start:1089 stop:1817 length:729 start_codon:yes stop_codon:yes gene_type:complete
LVSRKIFAANIVGSTTTHVDRSIAFLWFYRQTAEYADRTAAELAQDLHDEDFSKPRVSRLHKELVNSRYTVKGGRPKSFKISLANVGGLDAKYDSLLGHIEVPETGSVLPVEWVRDTRRYVEDLIKQINGSFDFGFYDASAVLMRRLVESLIIEIYIRQKRGAEIRENSTFKRLEFLIGYVCKDQNVHLSRNSNGDMNAIKKLGDTAAHDRTYITHESDITDLKQRYRRLIKELLTESGVVK